MKKIFLFTSFIILLLSCNTETNTDDTSLLSGDWFMDDLTYFDVFSRNLSEEYILFTFNTDSNILEVVNYNSYDALLPTGEYNFIYTENEIVITRNDQTLTFNYRFEGENLIFEHQEQDNITDIEVWFTPKMQNCINNPFEELEWLNDIKIMMTQLEGESAKQIIQFVYNDECVYLTKIGGLIKVYNTQGTVICEINGTTNSCPDFYDVATNRRILFSDLIVLSE